MREDHEAAASLGQDHVGREGHAADLQAKLLHAAIFAAVTPRPDA